MRKVKDCHTNQFCPLISGPWSQYFAPPVLELEGIGLNDAKPASEKASSQNRKKKVSKKVEIRTSKTAEVSGRLARARRKLLAAENFGLRERYGVLLREYAALLGIWEEMSR